MRRQIGLFGSCMATMAMIAGCRQSVCCDLDAEARAFVTPVPIAYSTRDVGGKRYTISVASFLNQQTPRRFFNYMIADEHAADGVADEPILETHLEPNTLVYRGNLIIFVFGGWGRVRSEHIVTASEALTSPPFGIYPVTPTQYIVMTFANTTADTVSLKATHGTNESKPLKANQYVIVDVDPSTLVTTFSEPDAIPSSLPPTDPVAIAFNTITSLRTELHLP